MQVKPSLDQQVVRCLVLLRDPAFAPLVKYLREQREYNSELRQSSDTHIIFRAQGAVSALDDLLGDIERSQELVAKLRTV